MTNRSDAEDLASGKKGPNDEAGPDIQQLLAATAASLLVGLINLALPDKLTFGPPWLLLVIVALLAAPAPVFALLIGHHLPYRLARGLAIALLAVLSLALVASVLQLVLNIATFPRGLVLLVPASLLWASNVLVFSFWYWEVDGGGPLRRHRGPPRAWDFAFPQHQMSDPSHASSWLPGFIDYLFLAFNTSTALSPADTYPLRQRVKALMMAQSAISLLIIVLLVGRSVNILS